MTLVKFGKQKISVRQLVAIARHGARIELTRAAEEKIKAARELVERWVREGRSVYGVTTGFGALSDVVI